MAGLFSQNNSTKITKKSGGLFKKIEEQEEKQRTQDFVEKQNTINSSFNRVLKLNTTTPTGFPIIPNKPKATQEQAKKFADAGLNVANTVPKKEYDFSDIPAPVSFATGLANSATMGLIQGQAKRNNSTPKGLPQLSEKDPVQEFMEQSQEQHPIAYGGGQMAGYLIPGVGIDTTIGKAATKLGIETLPKIAQRAAIGSASGAITTGLDSSLRGNSAAETAKQALIGGIGGGVLDAGVSALGKGLSKLSLFKKLDPKTSEIVYELPKPEQLKLPSADRLLLPTKAVSKIEMLPVKPNQSKTLQQGADEFYNNAVKEYTDAIETIQNRFGTNQLRQNEVDLIKSELGIDLDEILNKLDKAENFVKNPSEFAKYEKSRLAAGVINSQESKLMDDLAMYKTAQNNLTDNSVKVTPNMYQNAVGTKEIPFREIKGKTQPSVTETIPSSLNNSNLKSSTNTGDEISKLYSNTIKNSNFMSDIEKAKFNADEFKYTTKSEAESVAKAKSRIANNGIDAEVQNLSSKEVFTGEDLDTSMEILKQKYLNEARQTGDYSKVTTWLKSVSTRSTEAGRAVQAHAKYSKTSEGMLLGAQRAVEGFEDVLKKTNPAKINKINTEANNLVNDLSKLTPEQKAAKLRQMFKDAPKRQQKTVFEKVNQLIKLGAYDNESITDLIKLKEGMPILDSNDIKFITEGMEKYNSLPEGWDKQVELYKVQKLIADKIPSDWVAKYKGLQRISYLLNPKTLLTRNPVGNLLIGTVENIKDIPATAVDTITGLFTGNRTTMLPTPERLIEQGKGMATGLKDTAKDFINKVDTSPTRGQAEIPKGDVFNSKALNELDRVTSRLLQFGDRPFYQGAYNDRLLQLKKLNKTDTITDAMINDAKEYALEKTFQNDTTLSKAFQKLKNVSDNNIIKAFLNTVLPFAQTPANILNKLLEYTPMGLTKSVMELGKIGKGTFNQKRFVDNIGRSLTGTGIIALGYSMADKGILKGQREKSDKVAEIERLLGIQAYSINFDNKSYTIDWAQPVSALLAMGADAYYAGKDKESFSEQLTSGAESAGNTFFNMSMLQSLNKLFNSYSPSLGFIGTVTNSTSLANPSLLKQTAKVIDPYVRDTTGDNIFETTKNKFISGLPFASKLLPAKLDSLGQPIEQFQGRSVPSKIFESYFSPGFIAENKGSRELNEIYRIYKSTGKTDVIPKISPSKITDNKETFKLSAEEQRQFQIDMGNLANTNITNLINSPIYQQSDDETKSNMLKKIMEKAYDTTKQKFLEGHE